MSEIRQALFSKKEIARYLGFSERKIELLMGDGTLPYIKCPGGSVRFDPNDCIRQLKARFGKNSYQDEGVSSNPVLSEKLEKIRSP